MKSTLLATAVGLAFIGASAPLCYAQPSPQTAGGDFAQYGAQQDSPGDAAGDWRDWRREHHWRYSQNEPDQQAPTPHSGPGAPPLPPPHPVPHPPPPPPPANAAHFVFQRGRARIDITCPQVFALNDCVQAATELLDKIHSLHDGQPHRAAAASPGSDQVPGADAGNGNDQQPRPGGPNPPPTSGGDNQM